MFPIIDVTDWVPLSTEQMGTKPKYWCLDDEGAEFLFKECRKSSGENWSEKIAAEIAGRLGLPHAPVELAFRNDPEKGIVPGTISRNFLPPDGQSSLIHGNELLLELDPRYPAKSNNYRPAQHTLGRIFSAIESSGARLPANFPFPVTITNACEQFVGYLLLDALISNTDRHHENWAVVSVITEQGSPRFELAPTFDHASSLGRELKDVHRIQKLEAEKDRIAKRNKPRQYSQTVAGYLQSSKGLSRIYESEQDLPPIHPLQAFRIAHERYPDAANTWLDLLARISPGQFEEVVSEVPEDAMSKPAREFCLCLINLNRTALINRTFHYD